MSFTSRVPPSSLWRPRATWMPVSCKWLGQSLAHHAAAHGLQASRTFPGWDSLQAASRRQI
eukprot:9302324-Pyramimonas_sp.AAC.1